MDGESESSRVILEVGRWKRFYIGDRDAQVPETESAQEEGARSGLGVLVTRKDPPRRAHVHFWIGPGEPRFRSQRLAGFQNAVLSLPSGKLRITELGDAAPATGRPPRRGALRRAVSGETHSRPSIARP